MDKELLFKSRLDEADVEIPGVGTVRVRALSRDEVLAMRKATDAEHVDGPRVLVIERKMVAAAMVDPELTEAEVRRWQHASRAGELDLVTDAIQELSGLNEGASKSGVPGDGDDGSGVRALPGGEADDDGAGDAPEDGQR